MTTAAPPIAEAPSGTDPSARPGRGGRISGGGLIMVVVIAASVLLSWHALQRHGDARRQQATLVDATSRAAAREITLELQELRRSVRLLADAHQPRIQFLASHPDDQAAFQALNATVRADFPEGFAVTLADAHGRELINNSDDGIQDVCRQDMVRFAGSGKPAAALIHPNPAGYHFDVTVPVDLGGRQGVFFVSFHPELISRVLHHNELDGHHIYLVKAGDDRDLIEVGAQGSRDQLQRAFFLAPGERQRVVARTPVAGTQWDLVLVPLPDEGAFLFSKPAKDAAISIALLLSIGGLAAWWVRNAQRQVAQRDRQWRRQARELEHSEHRLRLLHETTSAANLGRAAKIDAVLKMGLQEFGLEPLASTCGSLMQAYRSDRQLHESMQIQAAILRTTRYMVIATDPQGVIITFNEAAEQALGYCAEELVGTHTPAIFHDPDEVARRAVEISAQRGYEIEPGFETFVHTVRGGNVEERIWKYVRKDGTAFPVLLTVNALTDHNGEITGFLGVAKDITEQLAAEEVVRRSQARLAEAEQRSRLLLECAGDGIYGLDRRGRTVFVNPAAARMLGYEVEALIGTPMHKLVHHSHADGTPYAPKDCPMYAAFRDGQVQRVKDEVLWRKDGTCFPVEYTSTPIRNGGETVGAVVIFKDVTEARASELALRGSEARLAEAQRIAHLGSWEWNVRTHETYWSDETFRIFGYRPRSFEPDFARYAHHIHSDDRQRVIEALSKAAADGTPFECGYRIVTANGSERDVNDRGQCVVDATGSTKRMIGIVQDVTEQRKVERMKNEFVSTVSHELRTPLTSIRGSLGLLSGYMTDDLPEKARELIAIAQRNSERLLLLINDILDLSKIESGRLAFHMRELELDEFLRQAVLANQGYAEQYRVALVLEQPKQAVRIQADPDRLMQVMNNLLSNAAKFSPPGTQVRIRVGIHGDRVRIQVCDRGPGIPAAFQSRVFERFTQADASDTRELGGTGLGLSIAKAIVERHGGEIGFDTGSGGTTFHFDLAVAKSAASTDSPARGADMQTPARILVCEDDPDAARLIGLLLQQQGYEADFAHSATAARALLERHRYCALTLDILLPDGDGLQLLQELRRADATRALPVVVVSAVADETRRSLNGTALEVLDWLDKPIDHQRLTAALARLSTYWTPRRPRVLHVEDDGDICEIVRLLLNEHADVDQASTISQARTALQRRHFDLILLDLELPDGSGLALLDEISAKSPVTPAVVFSATELDEAARAGVHACFVKSRTSDQELRDRLLASLPGTVSACLRPCVETANP